MEYVAQHGGHIIYLDQEGRGIGLAQKIKAYKLQEDEQVDTIEANLKLGHPIDARTYENAYYAIKWLGLEQIQLMTNNPLKLHALQNLDIVTHPMQLPATKISTHNENYIRSKVEKLHHHSLGKFH